MIDPADSQGLGDLNMQDKVRNIRPSVSPVWISTISLDQFRNYSAVHLDLGLDDHPAHIVLTGANGSGKTNLLEALSFLSPGRGLRRANYAEIALMDGDGRWSVSASLRQDEEKTLLGTGLREKASGERQRRIRINGADARSAEAFSDYLTILWLTPQMDSLFTGPSSERRKWVDRMVLAIDKNHGMRVNAFEKAMRQRNRLLEEAPDQSLWLDGIETQMAETGIAIATARAEMLSLLIQSVADLCEDQDFFPRADIRLEGALEEEAFLKPSVESEEGYRKRLFDMRMRDRAVGRTLEGPHRSDLIVHHAGKAMPAAKCSTGEQKALLLGLVLAHAHLVALRNRKAPIILLDEVAAHLDEKRRLGLFDLLDRLGAQAWVTGTDDSVFAPLGDRARRFIVQNASLTPIDI